MSATIRSKRLMLRAVLRGVSPMVVRLLSVSDDMELPALHDAFQQVLGWSGQLGYAFRIHGQEVKNAQRSKTVKVLSRGYANESSGASIKARFQKPGSSKRAASASMSNVLE